VTNVFVQEIPVVHCWVVDTWTTK